MNCNFIFDMGYVELESRIYEKLIDRVISFRYFTNE